VKSPFAVTGSLQRPVETGKALLAAALPIQVQILFGRHRSTQPHHQGASLYRTVTPTLPLALPPREEAPPSDAAEPPVATRSTRKHTVRRVRVEVYIGDNPPLRNKPTGLSADYQERRSAAR
jgi:hypothetical protein